MFNNRAAVAALTLVLIVVGGGFALSRLTDPRPGGPGVTPVPTPSVMPTHTPSQSVVATIDASSVSETLPAGTYQVEGFAAPFRVTVPAGWTATELTLTSVGIADASDGTMNIFMAVVNKVYPDPCHTKGTANQPVRVSPGVDGLVNALSSVAGFQVTGLTDTALGGVRGNAFRFGNDIDVVEERCTGDMLPFVTHVGEDGQDVDVAMFGGESDQFWVLLAGDVRVLIAVTDSKVSAVQPVLDSVTFVDE